jgi:heme exporter protein A
MALDFTKVSTRGLTKMYGVTRALAGVDLDFEAGKVTVVEGPNGSGKSTLLALLAQLARPTRGQVFYGDVDGAKAKGEVRRHLGVLAHASMLYPDLNGKENLELFARLYDVDDPHRRVDDLAERFDLGRFFDRPVRTYSRGQLQRVALARAIIHRPRLLLLDEPSTGLDVKATERLVDAVRSERARGAICVLITHDPVLAESVGDVRVALSRGKVVEAPEPSSRGLEPSA